MCVSAGVRPRPCFWRSSRRARRSPTSDPLPAGFTTREAVRRLNDWFRLRDCPQSQEMTFADQPELFALPLAPGCIRHEIGNCLGPCAAACSQDDYAVNVRAVLAFLRGEDVSPLAMLEREMTAASATLEFERAAALRDKLDSLTWLCEHLRRVREASRHSFIYPVRGHDERELWYLIHGGRVCAIVPSPQNDASRRGRRGYSKTYINARGRVRGRRGWGRLTACCWWRRGFAVAGRNNSAS